MSEKRIGLNRSHLNSTAARNWPGRRTSDHNSCEHGTKLEFMGIDWFGAPVESRSCKQRCKCAATISCSARKIECQRRWRQNASSRKHIRPDAACCGAQEKSFATRG